MTRRSKILLVVSVLFNIVNLVGAGVAAVAREPLHAGVHVALLLVGTYLMWRLVPGRYAGRIWRPGGMVSAAGLPDELTDRLTRLEQSVDAVAVEVERIGEGQRFVTRVFTENGTPRAPGASAAEPVETNAREAAPNVRRD
jgi:hypothetical protein